MQSVADIKKAEGARTGSGRCQLPAHRPADWTEQEHRGSDRDARSSCITMNGVGCSVRLLGWTEHRERGARRARDRRD